MSLNVVLTLLRLFPISSSARDSSVEIEEESVGWLYQLPSRGVYSVLVCLILLCYIISSIQNKLRGKNGHLNFDGGMKSLVDSIWHQAIQVGGSKLIHCCPLRVPGFPSLTFNSFKFEEDLSELSYGNLCEKVSAAENELSALRYALELATKSGKDLEESLEEVEKDKGEIVDRYLVEKQRRLAEMDNVYQDMTRLRQQLNTVKQERDEVRSKCANLAEEAVKAGEMLEKRQEIQSKLDEAQQVVAMLRKAVTDLEEGRRGGASGTGADDFDKREMEPEGKSIKSGMQNFHVFDRGDKVVTSQLIISDSDDADEHTEDQENCVYIRNWSDKNYFEPASAVDQAEEQDYDSDEETDSDDESDDEMTDEQLENEADEQMRLKPVQLTNTEAFKMFVQSNFGSP